MKCKELPLAGAYLMESESFADHRGRFTRIFCSAELQSIGLGKPVVQVNVSETRQKGAVRGMHFQHPPYAEIKIIRCLRGTVFDVIVDLREGSDTFLRWHGEVLDPERMHAIYVPEGFAHGFQVVEENAQLLYMHTAVYAPKSEGGVRFDDPAIGIEWPLPPVDISERDKRHPAIDSNFNGIEI